PPTPTWLPGLNGISWATMKRSWYAFSLIRRTVLMLARLSAIAFIQMRCVVSADCAVSNTGNMPIRTPPGALEVLPHRVVQHAELVVHRLGRELVPKAGVDHRERLVVDAHVVAVDVGGIRRGARGDRGLTD